MTFRSFALAGACALGLTCGHAASAPSAEGSETLSHGLFDKLLVFKPEGAVRSVVLLLSGLDGVTALDRQRAQSMAATGSMVALADTARFYTRLEAEGGRCTYPNGAFENLGRHLQAYYHLPGYQPPMLVGRADGGTLAYAMLAQAAPGTFASALSLGFCPRLPFKLPMCEAYALKLAPADGAIASASTSAHGSTLRPGGTLAAPWVTLAPPQDAACGPVAQAFVEGTPSARRVALGAVSGAAFEAATQAAHAQLVAHTAAPQTAPASLAGLPIVEVPVTDTTSAAPPLFAVLLSGDGGWAGIDKDLAAALAKRNVPVAGFDSLRYFWSARTPESLAADLDRLIRYYAAHWGRAEVLLIGYSQGADVLPFALNRLPAATRVKVKLSALLGPGQKASFEFHVTNWIGKSGDRPIAPEAMRLPAADVLCVHGSKERDSLCPQLAPQHAQVLQLTGDHHFDGDYDKLAQTILDAALKR